MASEASVPRRGRVRWAIALMLGVGVLINYFDRVNLSVAAPGLRQDFGLSPAELGILFSSFAWSYGLMQIPMGLLMDRIGVRWLMRLTTVLWSVATFMTAAVSGLGLVMLSRILLGISEAPALVSSQKATGYWFPRHERGLCTAMFDGAAKFSNVVGVPLMSVLVVGWGWRSAFVVCGVVSVLFAVAFWVFYRNPRDMHRAGKLSEGELRYITEGGAQDETVVPPNQVSNLGYLLRQRKVWGLSLGFACYGYAFFMLLTWLPSYLVDQMHMTVLKGGLYTAVPWLVATLADVLVGGLLVDKLIARGHDANRVRKAVLIGGMVMGLCVLFAATTDNAVAAVTWISLGLGGLSASAPVGSSCVALIAPEGSVGGVGGILNFTNQVFASAAPIVTGFLVAATGSFAPGFVAAAIMIAIGIVCYLVLLGNIEQLPARAAAARGGAVAGG